MIGRSFVTLSVLALLLGSVQAAAAAPKARPRAAAPKPKKAKPANKEKPKQQEAGQDKSPEDPPEHAAEDAKSAAKEEALKAAGTSSAAKSSDAGAVKVKEDKEGVKTYKFETVEVEGRLKSPQVIYFLRRVRAEFEAGALGHRSFLGELSDSRRSAAFR
jgi:hypothetical protein